MNNLYVEQVVQVTCNMTARDWCLTQSDDPSSARVAKGLNSTLEMAVRERWSRDTVEEVMRKKMLESVWAGASDLDCRNVLTQVLDEVFTRRCTCATGADYVT